MKSIREYAQYLLLSLFLIVRDMQINVRDITLYLGDWHILTRFEVISVGKNVDKIRTDLLHDPAAPILFVCLFGFILGPHALVLRSLLDLYPATSNTKTLTEKGICTSISLHKV